MAPARVLAEYAKSGRSSCKSCGKSIASASLRVGSSAKDPRGFDSTKWYHLDCFRIKSHPIATVEQIIGFSSLKSSDKELLRKLEADELSSDAPKGIKRNTLSQSEESSTKKKKLQGVSDSGDEELNGKSLETKRDGLNFSFSVSNIKDKYKDADLSPNWKAFETVIFREREEGLNDSAKIAAFDFDGCLANTSVRRIGVDAWSLMYPDIPEKLQRLYNDGYKLVIFTNESNIERWKNKRQQAVDSKIGRLDNFINCVKVPIQVFIACGIGKEKGQKEDLYRKPNIGMWRLMELHFNSGIAIDMDQSFYVGDAAGRAADHSDADIEFAKAIGLRFYVPEEYFDAKRSAATSSN